MKTPATKSKVAPKKFAASATAKKTVSKKSAINGNGASKIRAGMQPLEPGQIWQMKDLNLQVGLVGKLLVHYKLAKPDAVRIANSVGGRATVEKYLKSHKAVLLRVDKVAAARANKI